MDQHGKEALDGVLGIGAVTSPFWLQAVQTGIGLFMLIGGAILLALRLAIAWREWRVGK
jgi:hypothetical protein